MAVGISNPIQILAKIFSLRPMILEPPYIFQKSLIPGYWQFYHLLQVGFKPKQWWETSSESANTLDNKAT